MGLVVYASAVQAFGADSRGHWQITAVVFTEGLPAIRDTLIIAGIGHAARRVVWRAGWQPGRTRAWQPRA